MYLLFVNLGAHVSSSAWICSASLCQWIIIDIATIGGYGCSYPKRHDRNDKKSCVVFQVRVLIWSLLNLTLNYMTLKIGNSLISSFAICWIMLVRIGPKMCHAWSNLEFQIYTWFLWSPILWVSTWYTQWIQNKLFSSMYISFKGDDIPCKTIMTFTYNN